MALGAEPLSILNRMRLSCTAFDEDGKPLISDERGKCWVIEPLCRADVLSVGDTGWQVMNEVTLHRGRYPHLTVVDAFFDGQHLTEAVVSPCHRLIPMLTDMFPSTGMLHLCLLTHTRLRQMASSSPRQQDPQPIPSPPAAPSPTQRPTPSS
jgi:hypothetical protein